MRQVGLLAAMAMLLAISAGPRAAIASNPAAADGWVLADLPQPGGKPALVRSVAAGPAGFVAVGEICHKGQDCEAAAWHSQDGVGWRVATLDRRERKAGRALDSSATDVTWGPRGYVAVGWYRPSWDVDLLEPGRARGGPEPVAAIWRSKDGRNWKRATRDAPFGARAIVASDEGYVLLHESRPRTATSPDGRRWTPVPRADLGGGRLRRLVLVDDGYAAIGDAAVDDGEGKPRCCWPAVWRSTNLVRWSRLPEGTRQYDVESVARIPDLLAAVGLRIRRTDETI